MFAHFIWSELAVAAWFLVNKQYQRRNIQDDIFTLRPHNTYRTYPKWLLLLIGTTYFWRYERPKTKDQWAKGTFSTVKKRTICNMVQVVWKHVFHLRLKANGTQLIGQQLTTSSLQDFPTKMKDFSWKPPCGMSWFQTLKHIDPNLKQCGPPQNEENLNSFRHCTSLKRRLIRIFSKKNMLWWWNTAAQPTPWIMLTLVGFRI